MKTIIFNLGKMCDTHTYTRKSAMQVTMALKSLITGLFSKLLFLPSVFLVGCLFFISPVKSQIQAGLDAGHPTTILVNTDSIYMQNQSYGWFIFSTHNINNVSGNLFNLKAAFVPTSSKVIQYDTVTIRVVNLYDSTLNLIASDTLHSNDTLEFAANVNTNSWYYIQTVANYPCNTCIYNEAVTYNMQILAPIPTPTLNLCNFCSNTLSGTLTVSPPPNQSYCINNDIYIFSPITFQSSEFKIKPGVRIVVGNAGSLTIDNSHLYTCSGMWKGIIVYNPSTNGPSNGKVFIQNNSLIESANSAVSFPYGNTNVFTNFFGSFETVFNKNDTAIVLRNYSPSGSSVPIPYLFGINRTIITCRTIPYSFTPPFVPPAAYYSNVKATATNTGVPYASPYINNAVYTPTLTQLGKNSMIGIYLYKVGKTTLSLTFYQLQIGSTVGFSDEPFINIFDNLMYGIYAVSSNFDCVNNVFQNGKYNKFGVGGRGIYAEAERSENNRISVRPHILPFLAPGSGSLINYWGVGVNKFFDLSRAIQTENYIFHELINNDIRSSQINPLPSPPTPFHKGEYGIFIRTNRFHVCNIKLNTLINVENAIAVFVNFGTINIPSITPGPVNNSQYLGSMKIDSNFIQPNFPSSSPTPITTQYVSNGIYLANTVPTPSVTSYINPTLTISVSKNSIKNVYRGIYITGFQNKTVNSNLNCILLSNDISTSNPIQYGILREFMQGVSTSFNQIISNKVTGTGTSNPNMSGIYIRGSWFENVRCNNVSNVSNAIVFDKCPNTCSFIGNTMTNYARGFSLINTSIIGPQGAIGAPSDNQWMPSCPTGIFKTYVNNANPSLSPLYVRPAPPSMNPQGCCFNPSPGGPCYDAIILPVSLFYTTGPITLPCPINNVIYACGPWILPPYIATPPSTVFPVLPPVPSPTNAITSLMEKIVQNQVPLLPVEDWTKKISVFRSIKQSPALTISSPVLNNFYNANINSNYNQLTDIELDLSNGDYSSAQNKIASFTPQNIFEQNFKLYYQIYTNFAISQNINTTDSTLLAGLASSCSLLNGDAVFLARALFNTYFETIQIWDDNCNNSGGQRLAGNETSYQLSANNFNSDFVVFPNPANNEVFVSNLSGQSVQFIKVYDISGKEVMNIPSPIISSFPYRIPLQLSPGFYRMEIYTSDNKHIPFKLVVE